MYGKAKTLILTFLGGKRGLVVRALDLKSGGPGFKSCSLPLDGFVFGVPEFNSSTLCIIASWSASYQLGFLTNFCSTCNFCLPIYQWHACELLAELSACRAKCMTTIKFNMIFLARHFPLNEISKFFALVSLVFNS